MANIEELLNQEITEKTRVQNESTPISKIHLKYAYGQLKLSEETSRQCNFAITGGKMSGFYEPQK